MATSTDRIQVIFQDARELQADALELLALGKVRNAAEKAWGATKRATLGCVRPSSRAERPGDGDSGPSPAHSENALLADRPAHQPGGVALPLLKDRVGHADLTMDRPGRLIDPRPPGRVVRGNNPSRTVLADPAQHHTLIGNRYQVETPVPQGEPLQVHHDQ